MQSRTRTIIHSIEGEMTGVTILITMKITKELIEDHSEEELVFKFGGEKNQVVNHLLPKKLIKEK